MSEGQQFLSVHRIVSLWEKECQTVCPFVSQVCPLYLRLCAVVIPEVQGKAVKLHNKPSSVLPLFYFLLPLKLGEGNESKLFEEAVM